MITSKSYNEDRNTTMRSVSVDDNFKYMIARLVEFCNYYEDGREAEKWFDILFGAIAIDSNGESEEDGIKVVFEI